MGRYLEGLGLNSLTQITGNLGIYINMTGSVQSTSFLPNLTSALGNVNIREFNLDLPPFSVSADPVGPAIFFELPLRSVKVVGGSLNAGLTGLIDMSSFAGLRCIGKSLNVYENPQLTTLAGLEGLETIDAGNVANATNPSIYIRDNVLLNNPSGFANKFRALTRVAGCSSSPPPNLINITVARPEPCYRDLHCTCVGINTFGKLCSFINDGPFVCSSPFTGKGGP